MNCNHVQPKLDAYIDNELDAQTSMEITQHLAGCAACRAAQAERDSLRATLRAHAPYHHAPTSLRQQIEAFDGGGAQPTVTPRRQPGWFAAGALACATALLGLITGLWLAQPATEDPLREQIAASHVASLTGNGRLLDVIASDQHVVKPWFQGKVDFAPVVRDFATEGFKLAGARLDHIGDRQAAAIVYRIRNHVVNVFVWRAQSHESHEPSLPSTSVARGYGLTTWASGGLRYAAISDVEARDLERLAELMSR